MFCRIYTSIQWKIYQKAQSNKAQYIIAQRKEVKVHLPKHFGHETTQGVAQAQPSACYAKAVASGTS
jgi:hypothetical protein